tara:strand:- start:427 stop:750 length:324 start_codon:yes stop_codon:yes gene_type:complete
MNIKEFKTWEEDNKIYVHISTEQWNEPKIPKVYLETTDILTFLESKEIEVGNCIQTAKIKNWRAHTCASTWIFEKKSVDKPEKQVILKEEKPKTTRKRRTKKASTEE